MVSVIIRTTGRDTLDNALDSVRRQHYPQLEVVLVDATGNKADDTLDDRLRSAGDISCILVTHNEALNRPRAANAGLDRASGDFILFLDDDDWIAPEHIDQLVDMLKSDTDTGVAYSSAVETDPQGNTTDGVFAIDYRASRLRHDNFIPIHTALFRRELIEQGCRFDETLDIFEDWDFWLQLSCITRFRHLDSTTAFYRQGGDSETASRDDSVRYQQGHPVARGRERLFQKWLPRWSGADYNNALASLDSGRLLEQLHQQLNTANKALNKANKALNKRHAEMEDTRNRLKHTEQELDRVYHSVSWKLTRPYRWLREKAHRFLPDARRKGPGYAAIPLEESGISFCLDVPGPAHHSFNNALILQGWSAARSGLEKIEVRVDGHPVDSFLPDTHRSDLEAAHPDAQKAGPAGFNRSIALPELDSGRHELLLALHARDGRERTVASHFQLFNGNAQYNNWYWQTQPDTATRDQLRQAAMTLPDPGIFHILLVCDNNDVALAQTLVSIAEQCHPWWSLHLCGRQQGNLEQLLRDAGIPGTANVHVHRDTASAWQAAGVSSQWTLCLMPGETLAPQALWEIAAITDDGSARIVYSDHDRYDDSGAHLQPCFTPTWSPDHLLSSNYVGGVFAFHSLPDTIQPDITANQNAWRYALLLKLVDQCEAEQIFRIPAVLWSEPRPTQTQIAENLDAESSVVQQTLARRGQDASVDTDDGGIRHIHRRLSRQPLVSIIIPTTGKLDLLQPCLDSLLSRTRYANYEIIMLDNSRGKQPEGIAYLRDRVASVIECDEAFNWARLNNIGARASNGELLLFMNDDIEITDPYWLQALVSQAVRPDVGAVGAKLLYPNGALQHCGVTLVNYGGGGIHLLHKVPGDADVYRHLHHTVREVSANTGACLMLSRDKFEAIKGFDENLAVVGNDVDLCLRLQQLALRNLWTPDCCLIHHESISRKSSVPRADEQAMWQRWGNQFKAGDPYYNPNLSSERCDFSLDTDSRPPISNRIGTHETPVVDIHDQPGVNLIGYIRAEMGIGEGARSDARALDAARQAFGIINFESGNPARMTDLSWQHKEMAQPCYDINLLHINPDHAAQAVAELPESVFRDRYTIGYWAWELPEMPDAWESCFCYVDEVWVPSTFVQHAIAEKSPVPVVTIPHAIELDFDPSAGRADFGLPEDAFLFLCMFDIYSIPERKNPHAAIRAFKQAFSPDDMSVRLLVKINNPTTETLAAIRPETKGWHNIMFLKDVYTRRQVNTLIANIDCFVSLHRSEGFGLGPAEAMSVGKAVIATHWSGNIDYMTTDNSLGIGYTLVELDRDYGPYNKGQVWADADIGEAASAMRSLKDDPELAQRLGARAQQTIRESFSPQAVGRLMRRRLDSIRRHRRAITGEG